MAEDQNNQPNGSPEPSQKAKPEKRNLEDLWQQLCLFHTESVTSDGYVYQYKWSFSTLEDALEEGGEKVHLFGCTEPHLIYFQGEVKVIIVPVVVAVVSPFPPCNEIAITLDDRLTHEIVPMKQLEMDWVPYIPLQNRESQIERPQNSRIFTLSRTKSGGLRRKHGKKFVCCFPYFLNPLKEDNSVMCTVVDIECPKPEIDTKFELGVDELEDFVDEHMESTGLPAKSRAESPDFVKEKVQEVKIFDRERFEAHRRN